MFDKLLEELKSHLTNGITSKIRDHQFNHSKRCTNKDIDSYNLYHIILSTIKHNLIKRDTSGLYPGDYFFSLYESKMSIGNYLIEKIETQQLNFGIKSEYSINARNQPITNFSILNISRFNDKSDKSKVVHGNFDLATLIGKPLEFGKFHKLNSHNPFHNLEDLSTQWGLDYSATLQDPNLQGRTTHNNFRSYFQGILFEVIEVYVKMERVKFMTSLIADGENGVIEVKENYKEYNLENIKGLLKSRIKDGDFPPFVGDIIEKEIK